MISFDEIPTDEKLMISVQDAWHTISATFPMVDLNSGILSIPIFTYNNEVMYIYTMTAEKGVELEPGQPDWVGN
jgi:hypothetical protein